MADSMTSWPDLLSALCDGEDLSPDQTQWAMGEILGGRANTAQVVGFAVGLRAKGETVAELASMAEGMLAAATPITVERNAVDIVGTGGDRANTVNVSTMAALVAAAAGAAVVKHGNRSASSMSGTADCLEALGVRIDVPPDKQQEVLAQCGIVFLFAPQYHPSLRHVAGPRRELGIRTAFNYLGPLANPARPDAQAIGVADARVAELMAGVLGRRGARGLVFHGGDGLDELTTTTSSTVWLIGDGRVVSTQLDPADLGLPKAHAADLVGGSPAHNARVVRDVLGGARGPVRDIVVLNAAAALLAYEGVDLDAPLTPQLRSTLELTERAIDDGRASATLEGFITATNRAVDA